MPRATPHTCMVTPADPSKVRVSVWMITVDIVFLHHTNLLDCPPAVGSVHSHDCGVTPRSEEPAEVPAH